MKFLFSLWLGLFFLILNASAQDDIVVSGRVIDNVSGEALPFASITVTAPENTEVIIGAIANDDGRFEIRGIGRGNYLLNISFIGYETIVQPLLIGELVNAYDIGRIELTPSTRQLDEVIIQAQKTLISLGAEVIPFVC